MSTSPAVSEATDITAVRFRLGTERAAPQPDSLGRAIIGYTDGLSAAELWERGRGVWKAKLATVAEAQLALVVVDDVVRLVATVDGVSFHEDRVAIEGEPLPEHPLVGGRDPLYNTSRNPVAYGTVRTVVGVRRAQRDYAEIFDDAVKVMTEAARWRRNALRPAADGGHGTARWEPSGETEQGDWAEFVAQVLAAAAANYGGVEEVLAGRPGSWEVDQVRGLLTSTVGEEREELWRYRTEPLRIAVFPDLLWLEELYDRSNDAIHALEDAATAPYDTASHRWTYRRDNDEWTAEDGLTGRFVAADRNAPQWSDEVKARWKDDLRAFGADQEFIELMPSSATTMEIWVSKSDEDRAEMARLYASADQAAAPYDRMVEALDDQHRRDVATYADQYRATLLAEAERRYPGLKVDVRVLTEADSTPAGFVEDHPVDSPGDRLVRHADENTPLPNSGLAPKDYSAEQLHDLAATEAEAGRLPHLRLSSG